jgi:hypothetical protein
MTALGVEGLLSDIRGGPGAVVLTTVAALAAFGLADYFVWSYR